MKEVAIGWNTQAALSQMPFGEAMLLYHLKIVFSQLTGVPMVRRNIPGVNHHMRQKGWKGNQNAHISRAVCGGHNVDLGGFHFHKIEHMIILQKSHILILMEKLVNTGDVEGNLQIQRVLLITVSFLYMKYW